MTNNLVPFTFEDTQVRTIMLNGEPWWVLADVCKVLETSNPSKVAGKLDEDEKANFKLAFGSDATIINESGLYSVILTSRKPSAKRFKKWVTSEVLPAIRKTGGYMVAHHEETPEQLMARALRVAEATLERVEAEKERLFRACVEKTEVVERQKTTVRAYEAAFGTDGLMRLSEACKLLKQSDPSLNLNAIPGALVERGWLYRIDKRATLPWRVKQSTKDVTKYFQQRVTSIFKKNNGIPQENIHVFVTRAGFEMLENLRKTGQLPRVKACNWTQRLAA